MNCLAEPPRSPIAFEHTPTKHTACILGSHRGRRLVADCPGCTGRLRTCFAAQDVRSYCISRSFLLFKLRTASTREM
eukprot:24869-Eustigmatos_ZCMA.PRE.1